MELGDAYVRAMGEGESMHDSMGCKGILSGWVIGEDTGNGKVKEIGPGREGVIGNVGLEPIIGVGGQFLVVEKRSEQKAIFGREKWIQ